MIHSFRFKIHNIIHVGSESNRLSTAYDLFMMLIISISIVPLAFKETTKLFWWFDMISAGVFILDYLLRWITADIDNPQPNWLCFLRYPLTPMAIIDLLSIIPSFGFINSGFKLLKLFRLVRTFRIFRVLKLVRYSKNIRLIKNVLRKQKQPLLCVCSLAVGYIIVSALVIFSVEPDSFCTFFDAVYWATVSLTTMGYGDIYPVTTAGRIVTMVSSLFGIAIVALPAGIITAGYMNELHEINQEKRNPHAL